MGMEIKRKEMEKKEAGIHNRKDLQRASNKRRKVLPQDAAKHGQRMQIIQEISTVGGVVHPIFNVASHAMGFLDDGNKWIECIHEAANWASGTQLRRLFATILVHCEVTEPKRIWDST